MKKKNILVVLLILLLVICAMSYIFILADNTNKINNDSIFNLHLIIIINMIKMILMILLMKHWKLN